MESFFRIDPTLGTKTQWCRSGITSGKWHMKNKKKKRSSLNMKLQFLTMHLLAIGIVVSWFWIACTMKTEVTDNTYLLSIKALTLKFVNKRHS